jgi:hypothetical protein
MKWYICLLALVLPVCLFADDFDNAEEMAVSKAKTFIKQNPIIEDDPDEIGLVNMWRRIQGLHDLLSLWDSNREAFEREDHGELSLWQIRQRIKSHKLYASYSGNDALVKILADIISLHANFADRYMNNEISYSPYADIAGYSILSGRYLAKSVWIRYGKCLRNRNPENKNQQNSDQLEDKLFM